MIKANVILDHYKWKNKIKNPSSYFKKKINISTKTFQAIRIFVNKEISELIEGLINATKLLKTGGTIIIVSFHSIEDKIIKFFFNNYSKNKSNLIGLGIDFHRFNNKKGKLILCGVKIPFHKTLIAHSDGDLGYHAISDGILGAISEGDIGIHFPDTSKKNKNLNSAKILKYTYELMKKKINRDIKNIDLTFIGEEPKFSKYQKKMKLNISKLLNLNLNQINIKATTTEKMGPLGNKEGLGAFALVNII